MNYSAAQHAPGRTPRQLAAKQYDIEKRKILNIDEDGNSTKKHKAETPSYTAVSTMARATLNNEAVFDVLNRNNKPKTTIEIMQKAKLSEGSTYSALVRLVNAGNAMKLKFSLKSKTNSPNRFFYILIGKSYDSRKFVEVVK